jgi:hypothetical protein
VAAPNVGLAEFYPHYARWNGAIGDEFFAGKWRGVPVYLDVSSDTLTACARRVGIETPNPRADFVEAVASTLNLTFLGGNVFAIQRDLLRRWAHTTRQEPPWCVGLLALLSLAAEDMARDEQLSSNNYYGRLCHLLDVSGEAARRKLQGDFRDDSLAFWGALNSWLEDSERIYGQPTAFAFDRRRYVGIPISQALIKEHDRQHLREFFHAYRLAPRQRLALPQLTRLLENWLPSSGVSKGLKALWRLPEARERIATVAQLELEAWEGQVSPTDGRGAHETPLLLVGQLREHPVASLNLALRVRKLDSIPRSTYRLSVPPPPAAEAAFRAVGGAVSVEDTGLEDWLEVPESFQISIPDLLLAGIELATATETPFRLTRSLRRLIPLKLDEAHRLLVEVSRVELGEGYLLLAHKSLGADLESYLGKIALPGFRRWPPETLKGLPEDWLAFWRVTVANPAESPVTDLSILTPIAMTHLALGGGFALPGSMTWHVTAPPQVRVTALDEGDFRVSLSPSQTLSGESPEPQRQLGLFRQGALLDLARVDPPLTDGDYRISVELGANDSGESLASIGLRIRSGNHPRPQQTLTVPPLQHRFAHSGWGAVSATSDRDAVNGVMMRGAVLEGISDTEAFLHGLPNMSPLPPEQPGSPGLRDIDSEARLTSQATRATSQSPPCLNGSHYFHFPYYPPGRRPPPEINTSCQHCGFEKWFYSRRVQPQPQTTGTIALGQALSASPHSLPSVASFGGVDPTKPTWDDLLDALTFALGGTWESFASIAGQLDDTPWFPLEAARTLSALGHIDLEFDKATLRPRAWFLSPPALLMCSEPGEAFLCGARSRRLVTELRRSIEVAGGVCTEERNVFGPSTLRMLVPDTADLDAVATSTNASGDWSLKLVANVPERLLSALPKLHDVAGGLPSISWPTSGIEAFDAALAKWRPTSEPEEPGAYRFSGHFSCYAFVSLDDLARRRAKLADARLVKYLAAPLAGRSLVGYHRQSESLLAPWGAQLPGLYERVAVLCSGTAPIKLDDGTIRYPAVPPHIASRLWQLLCEERP